MVRSGHSGFSLVEIVTVLAVVGVLTALAMPSFRGLLADARVRSVASDLHTSLLLARSEAAKTNARVQLAVTGSDWSRGWTVRNTQGTVLFTGPAQDEVNIQGGRMQIVYLPSGRVLGGAPVFELRDRAGQGRIRCVTAEASGHAYTLKSACP